MIWCYFFLSMKICFYWTIALFIVKNLLWFVVRISYNVYLPNFFAYIATWMMSSVLVVEKQSKFYLRFNMDARLLLNHARTTVIGKVTVWIESKYVYLRIIDLTKSWLLKKQAKNIKRQISLGVRKRNADWKSNMRNGFEDSTH